MAADLPTREEVTAYVARLNIEQFMTLWHWARLAPDELKQHFALAEQHPQSDLLLFFRVATFLQRQKAEQREQPPHAPDSLPSTARAE